MQSAADSGPVSVVRACRPYTAAAAAAAADADADGCGESTIKMASSKSFYYDKSIQS